jgi:eukaryotic-like serine/threonine-protein kinase
VTLAPGARLSSYRLVEKLGEGGMGVVWRAVDETLDRQVAVKILPDLFAQDPERLSRFEREAKVLASLNHPGIATIHGLHESGGVRFLVMELVPGIDLSKRLEAGPIPRAEALAIGAKIAEALEAAHDHGVIHRDLKPANIQVTPDGGVKILDFGLAKAFDVQASGGSASISVSPTLTTPASTHLGVILGTASYMSPEQAKGKPVDRRTDIWALGCILFEMLAGRRPFQGEGVSEVLAAVIMAPIAFEELPASLPRRVDQLVRRCLERDPKRRLRDAGEARLVLEDVLAGKGDEPAIAATLVEAPASSAKLVLSMIGAAVAAALATGLAFRALTPLPHDPPLRRFEIVAKGPFKSDNLSRLVGLSPDGKAIAYVDAARLLIRSLASWDPTVIAMPERPSMLFWSPDSSQVGFTAAGKVWKVSATGGAPTATADIGQALTGGSSGSWCPDGSILLTTGGSGILRVPPGGGEPHEILPIETGKVNDIHEPTCLPDGSILYVPHTAGGRPDSLWILADGKSRELLRVEPDQDIWSPVYSPAGFILYHRHPTNTGIWALPFSLPKRRATGEPFLVVPDGDLPSVSGDGTLAYVKTSGSRLTQAIWVDRSGKTLGTIGPPQNQWPFPELSPDGRYMAIAAREGTLEGVWIHDVERGTRTRLSQSNVMFSTEAWAPDGKSIAYVEGQSPPLSIKVVAADGSGTAREISPGWAPTFVDGGRRLLHSEMLTDADWDLVDSPLDGSAARSMRAPMLQTWPKPSPDGRYLAFVSDESGVDEVYVRRYPEGEGKWQVSVGGGTWPRWSAAGDRLWYVRRETLMEVDVTLGPEIRLGAPRELFTRRALGWSLVFGFPPGYDVSPKGDRFVVIEPAGEPVELGNIRVVENWAQQFRATH